VDSCLAKLRIALGRDEEAEACFAARSSERGRPDYRVAAAMDAVGLAEFLARRARDAEGKALLEEAERTFDSGGFNPPQAARARPCASRERRRVAAEKIKVVFRCPWSPAVGP
jgi:hypothetical protein